MDIKTVPLISITPYARNAKKHPKEQVDKIAHQINSVGFLVPIIVDKHMIIIAGHGRYAAAQALNLTDVPVIVADHLTEDQAAAFRIADNKVAESEWDLPILAFELGSLERIEFDLTLTGMEKVEIESTMKMLTGSEPRPGEVIGSAPNFEPSSSENQSALDTKTIRTCPNCGEEF